MLFCCPGKGDSHSHHNHNHNDQCHHLLDHFHHYRCEKAQVRKQAPNFKGQSWWNNDFKEISLEQFKGKWVCLFFYPLDFTFVCPTEIIQFSDNSDKFNELNCQVVACSVDSHFSHREWALKPRDQGGLNPMKIPLLADISHCISKTYGVLCPLDDPMKGVAMRGTFLIDPNGILRHSLINDLGVGRNVDETLRTLKAFQHVDKHGEVCPAKWEPGKATMNPKHGSDKLNDYWKKEHAKKSLINI